MALPPSSFSATSSPRNRPSYRSWLILVSVSSPFPVSDKPVIEYFHFDFEKVDKVAKMLCLHLRKSLLRFARLWRRSNPKLNLFTQWCLVLLQRLQNREIQWLHHNPWIDQSINQSISEISPFFSPSSPSPPRDRLLRLILSSCTVCLKIFEALSSFVMGPVSNESF